jgi:hypothetical protein
LVKRCVTITNGAGLDPPAASVTLRDVKGSRYFFSVFAFRFYWPGATGLRLH